MSTFKPVIKKIEDDYEADQLVPKYIRICKTRDVNEADMDKAVDRLPDIASEVPEVSVERLSESAALQARLAVFEAIVDSEIDNIVEEAEENGETATTGDVEEAINPMVDTAVTMHLIPKMGRERVRKIISARLRRYNPQYKLLTDAADRVTNALVTMEDEDTKLSQNGLDMTPADKGFDIQEEVAVPTVEDVEVEEGVPPEEATLLRYLATSDVNRRKATVLVSRNISAPLLQLMTHRLKHHLSKRFQQKFNVH